MDAHIKSNTYVPQIFSSAIGFFDLPDKTRDDIYQRVLVVPHGIYPFQVHDGAIKAVIPGRPSRWLASMYTNQKMRGEASIVLYGRNRFVFMDTMGS